MYQIGQVSAEGEQFQAVGKMLGFDDWFKVAPSANQLAYISGEGRFFVENKKRQLLTSQYPSSKSSSRLEGLLILTWNGSLKTWSSDACE